MRFIGVTRTLSLMVLVSITSATTTLGQLNDGLIAYWSFDEGTGATAHDATGNHDLSLSLGATWTPQGVAGGALNTRTGAAITPHATELELGASFSVAFWARKDSGGGSGPHPMASVVSQHYCGQNGDGSWDVQFVAEPSANISLYTWPSSGPQQFTALPPGPVLVGSWYHVVVTHNASSGISTVYLDGAVVRSESWLPTCGGSPAPVLVGTDHYLSNGSFCGSNHFFDGDIDELRLYNRPLSSVEVARLIAQDTRNSVVPIISGTDGMGHEGALNSLDPRTRFVSASSPTESYAKVSAGQATQLPTDAPPDFVGSALSQGVTTSSPSDIWADFYYRFNLPSHCVDPVLRLTFTADDTTQVYLNGHYLGLFGDHAIAHELVVDNAEWFTTPSNELKFRVINNPWNPLVWVEGGVAKGGDRDGMWLEVEGYVAYDDAPSTGVFVVDYIRHVVEQFDNDGNHVANRPALAGERAYDAIFTPRGYYMIALSGTEGLGGAGLFDAVTGEFVTWLVQNPTDWFTPPTTYNLSSVAWGPDGTLYMTRNGINEGQGAGGVIAYHWNAGAADLIISGLPGATSGLSVSAEGHLFVAEPVADHVREYANLNGVWSNIRTLDVDYPAGTAIGPDGHLYVARPYANAVFEYALAGSPLQWTLVKQLPCGSLPGVVGLDLGPDDALYIAVSYGDRIVRYDFQTDICSDFLEYAPFSEPVNTVFRPIHDCNDNCIPDEEDIANCTGSAWCGDCNTNGIPDGCEPDFDGDGLIDDCVEETDIDNDGVLNEDDACDYTPLNINRALIEADGSVGGDLDGDCDVDLHDFQLMSERFSGPNPNPYPPHPWMVP